MPLVPDHPTTKITGAIIGAAIEVHRELGPGLLESAYQACLAYELVQRNVGFSTQVPLRRFTRHKSSPILKLMKSPVGVLLNFNVTALKRGIRRLENRHGEHREIREIREGEHDQEERITP